VRRVDNARDHRRVLRAAGARSQDQGGSCRAPSSGRGSGRRMSLSGLRASTRLDRRSPRSTFGRRRRDRSVESRAALPAASPSDPSRVRRRHSRGPARVPKTGRHAPRGSSATGHGGVRSG
jgi:hypothetical protein